jgi:transposase
VHEHILAHLRLSTKLFADETTAPVLDPGRGRTKTGQLWAYARDDRPWGGSDPPAVAYVYAPDRKASQPIAHLAGFKGVLQVDGYAGYRALAECRRRGPSPPGREGSSSRRSSGSSVAFEIRNPSLPESRR